jgi:hypothetical protein
MSTRKDARTKNSKARNLKFETIQMTKICKIETSVSSRRKAGPRQKLDIFSAVE